MAELSWKCTTQEFNLMVGIANRATTGATDYAYRQCLMDINATHSNGCPLDLEGLLTANIGDFYHDVYGIRRYIDRATGKLTEHFNPRYAR